jgi:tetratricopeptide (TPR) repeat protein
MGEYQKALPLLQRALEIHEKQLGPEHPNTAASLRNLAVVYDNMGDYPKALESSQAALNVENHTWAKVFAIASEHQKLQFVQHSQHNHLATLSLIHRHFQKDPTALRFGLESVLRRKGSCWTPNPKARPP